VKRQKLFSVLLAICVNLIGITSSLSADIYTEQKEDKLKEIPPSAFGVYRKKIPTCDWNFDHEECHGFHWDKITIQKKTSTTSLVSVVTRTINDHGCNYFGIGHWSDGKLVVAPNMARSIRGGQSQDTTSVSEGVCRIKIRIEGDVVTYDVEKGAASTCHENFCSGRGWLHFPEEARPYFQRKK
jgi:hypothetical protein